METSRQSLCTMNKMKLLKMLIIICMFDCAEFVNVEVLIYKVMSNFALLLSIESLIWITSVTYSTEAHSLSHS